MNVYGIAAGTVEYSRESAAVDINDFIKALEQAREDGATHIVGYSGNYRGPQYVRLGMPTEDDNDNDNYYW